MVLYQAVTKNKRFEGFITGKDKERKQKLKKLGKCYRTIGVIFAVQQPRQDYRRKKDEKEK